MKAKLFILISLLSLSVSAYTQKSMVPCFSYLDSKDFNLYMETQEVILIDVRLNKEYRKERIAGSYLASSRESLVLLLKKYDKNMMVLVYCEDGDRSETASEILCSELGFHKVYNLKGGLNQWKKTGYSVDKKRVSINSN